MSFNSIEVTLWLEQPRYDALQRILRESGTDLETVMQARLEEFYRQTVPDLEREKINLSMEAVRLAEERARLANMKISAFRIMENGQDSYFVTEQSVELLEMARLLRRYLRGDLDSGPKQFAGHFAVYKWLAEDQFQDYVQERMRDPYRIVGVYNVDFDRQEVSLVDAEQGWQNYRMRDVSTAVYAAFRSTQWIGTDERTKKFLNHLKGKEIATPQMLVKQDRQAEQCCAVFHVTEGGRSSRFMVEEKIELLQAANRLRSYIHKPKEDSPAHFADLFPSREMISDEQYDAFVAERLDNIGRVAGVYNIDLDKGTVEALNIMDGWQCFRIQDATTAAYFAMQRSHEPLDKQWGEFLFHLEGKQLTSDSEPVYLSGGRPLRAEDISFAESIEQRDNLLEFYMEVVFDPDKVFGTEVCTADNDDYVNLYANYDLDTQRVCDTLEVYLVRGDGGEQDYKYRLSEEERSLLLPAMEKYCQESCGLSLDDWRSEYLAEYQKEQRQTSQEMQM